MANKMKDTLSLQYFFHLLKFTCGGESIPVHVMEELTRKGLVEKSQGFGQMQEMSLTDRGNALINHHKTIQLPKKQYVFD